MTTVKTIRVRGMLGGFVDISKADFVNRWVDHARELHRLTFHFDAFDTISGIVETVRELAEKEFDRIYAQQES